MIRFDRAISNSCLHILFILGMLALAFLHLGAYSSNFTVQTDTIVTEKELSISHRKVVNSEQLQEINKATGQQLVKSINKVIKEERPLVEKEHLLLLSVSALREQAMTQKELPDSYRQILESLAKMQTKLLTTYSDGHNQLVFAYPYAQSAKSTLDFFEDISLTQSFLVLIVNGEYQQLLSQLPNKKSRQVNLLRPAINQLNKNQSEQLLFWANSSKSLASESILQLAIQSAQPSILIDTLFSDPLLPLHRYFPQFEQQWNADQRFNIFKQISAIKEYASVSLYQLAKLEIDEQTKHDYLLKALSSKTAGSTSAAILAKQMSAALVDELVNIVQSKSFYSTRQNALLSMLLSRNPYAFEQARVMYEQQLIGKRLAGEVSAWFE